MPNTEEAVPLLRVSSARQDLSADTSDDDADVQGFVRSCSFEALRGQKFGISMWRKMFHLLDIDGSGDVSCSELRRGLELLGFTDFVRNPMVLARIFSSIDRDNTGALSEREFLTFFNKFETEEELKDFISVLTQDANKMVLHVTTLFQDDGKNMVRVEDWNLTELPQRLEQLRGLQALTWIDAVGFQEEALRHIGGVFGLSVDTIIQSMTLQEPHVEVLRTSTGKSVVKVIVHSLELSDCPYKSAPKQWPQPAKFFYQVFCGPSSRVHKDCPDHVASKVLVSKRKVNNYSLAIEQSTLLMLDSHTVLTLRCPTRARTTDVFALETTNIGQFFSRFRNQLSVNSQYYSFLFSELDTEGDASASLSSPNGKVTDTADTLVSPQSRQQQQKQGDSFSPTSATTGGNGGFAHVVAAVVSGTNGGKKKGTYGYESRAVSALVLVLINCVFSGIYNLRDMLTDWEDVLHEEIQQNGLTLHTHHLSQLRTVVKQTILEVSAISNSLSPISWHLKKEAVEAKRNARIKHARKLRLVVEELMGRRRTSNEELLVIFSNNLPEFEELAQDMQNLNTFLGVKLEHVAELTGYLEAVRTDSTNRVLYALALLTAFTVPSGFLTGLFGMNFTDMHELDPSSGYGYKLFWIVLGVSLFLIILIMNRLGLFGVVLGR